MADAPAETAEPETDPTPDTAPPQETAPDPTSPAPPEPPATAPKPTPPPSVRYAEYDRETLEQELAKARFEAGKYRNDAKGYQTRIEELETANASAAEKALIDARKTAAAETEAKWRPAVVGVRAESALIAAGCTDPGDLELLVGKIDASKVEVDDNGVIVGGLTEQIESLKGKHAKLFAPPKPARPAPASAVDAGPKVPAQATKSASEQLAAKLLGGPAR